MSDIRVLTTTQLINAAYRGVRLGLNRQLNLKELESHADKHGFHVFEVVLPFHEAFDKSLPAHHRVMGLIKIKDTAEGQEVIFDVPTIDWNSFMTPEVFVARMAKIDPDLVVSVNA